MRLAFLTTMAGLSWGGSEALWLQCAQRGVQEGHRVQSVVFDWSGEVPDLVASRASGLEVVHRPRVQNRGLVGRALWKISPNLIESLDHAWVKKVVKFSPDVICVSQGSVWEIFWEAGVLRLLNRLACPVVHLCHSNNDSVVVSDQLRRTARRLYSKAARILFVADATLRMTERHLAMKLANAKVVRNPLNLASTGQFQSPRGHGLVFAAVGSLTVRYKAQDILLEVFGSPKWQERDWECRLYGEGPDRNYLERLAVHYGISDRVFFMGFVSDVRSIWEECDLLVMPSRVEGAPMALVEAMVCGRPAVVTDVGGMTEWVSDSQTGFVAEAPTVRSFGAALERAWEARDRWKDIGRAAHQFALARIDPDPAGTLLNLLLEVAEEGKKN